MEGKMTVICKSMEDLVPAARLLLDTHPGARVFAFYGRMGAGKTTFIKVICSLLGAADIIQSPSFSIINEYRTRSGESLFHFDFYRIRKLEEAFDIGYEDYLYSGSYCFIEWPELVEPLLPENVVRVTVSDDTERVISF
jgi:tRNA threonylcarbamoyladenosine biosynthesis protein TsaE